MKNILKITLLVLSVIFLVNSCQDTVEPDSANYDMTLRIKIVDQSGKPINSNKVEYALSNINSAGEFSPDQAWRSLSSVGTGQYIQIIKVPVMRENSGMKIKVDPPRGNDFKSAMPILDSLHYCNDTTLTFVFNRELEIDCGSNEFCSDDLDLFVNLDSNIVVDNKCSKLFKNTNSGSLVVTSTTLPTQSTSSTVIYMGKTHNTLSPIGTPALVPSGYFFQVCVVYSPITAEELDFVVSINTELENGDPCFSCQLNVNARAISREDCECPQESRTFVRDSIDLCMGDTLQYESIDLRLIKNDNLECDLVLRPVIKDNGYFDNNDIKLVEINGNSVTNGIILSPGEKMTDVLISFDNNKEGSFKDSLEFDVYRVTKNGEELCDVRHKVIVSGNVWPLECRILDSREIDNDNNLFKWNGTELIFEIKGCVFVTSDDFNRYIYLENLSEHCDLEAEIFLNNFRDENGNSISDSTFYFLARDTITGEIVKSNGIIGNIPSEGISNFALKFEPNEDDIWQDGDRTNPERALLAELTIRTNAGCDTTITIRAEINPTDCCESLGPFNMFDVDEVVDPFGYEILVDDKNTPQIVTDDYNVTGVNPDLSIYCNDINIPAGTAKLNGNGSIQYQLIVPNFSSSSFYDINDGKLCDAVPDLIDAGLITKPENILDITPQTDGITFEKDNLFLLWIETTRGAEFYGLLYIQDIGTAGKPVDPKPAVKFIIEFPF